MDFSTRPIVFTSGVVLHWNRLSFLLQLFVGEDFRPEYLNILKTWKRVNPKRVLCITATATPACIDGIRTYFQIETSECYYRSLFRPNIK